jgi:hypothetical protein
MPVSANFVALTEALGHDLNRDKFRTDAHHPARLKASALSSLIRAVPTSPQVCEEFRFYW